MEALTNEQKELLSLLIRDEYDNCEWYEIEKENNLIQIAEKLGLECFEEMLTDKNLK